MDSGFAGAERRPRSAAQLLDVMFVQYYLVPLIIVVVGLGLAALAFMATRKSRADVERYRKALPEEKADLDKRMARNPLLHSTMHSISIWELLGGAIVFFVIMGWLGN